MPKLKENQVPSYRLHKQSGQAIVTLNSRDFLLGKHGSAASKQEYQRLTGEWRAVKGVTPVVTGPGLAVSELVLAFWRHAQSYYRRPDGTPTSEVSIYKQVLRLLRRTYGHTPAKDFGPLCLKAVMSEMIALGWCRRSINAHAARIKHVFKWAVGNELVPASVHHGLTAVSGFARGRSKARESDPVRPVPEEHVSAVLPLVSPQVKAIIELQLVSGARPGEICGMRGCDMETTGKLWTYRPGSHKTQHHGHDRILYLGPRAQQIIRPFLKHDLAAYLFSPAEAEAQRREALHERRKTPLRYGNRPGTNRTRRRDHKPRDRYTVGSYRHAITRACEAAFHMPAEFHEPRSKAAKAAEAKLSPDVREKRRQERRAARTQWRASHVWHPHQLRHNAATRLRKEYGLEAAQVILGHKTLSVTEIYAEKNVEAAMRIMAQVG